MESFLYLRFIFTIVIGAILGLETETRLNQNSTAGKPATKEKFSLGGVRTYTIISLFGGVAGLFYLKNETTISYILVFATMLLVLSAYVLNVSQKKAFGMTTELAVLITFILGFLTTSSLVPIELIIVITVLLAFFLSNKRGITILVNKIEHKEIEDLFKFALVALVILPVLPNKSIFLSDIASIFGVAKESLGVFSEFVIGNPFSVWLLVVVISGFGLLGYLLSKYIGEKKGIILASFFSGFVSSTAALVNFSHKAESEKNDYNTRLFASGFLYSNAASFILLGVLIALNNIMLFELLLPFLLLFFVTSLIMAFLLSGRSKTKTIKSDNKIKYYPFSILPAIKFVLLISFINIAVQFLIFQNVSSTFLVTLTSLTGLTGVDAPSIAISSLQQKEILSVSPAVIAIVVTNYINFLGKGFYAYLSKNKKFGLYIVVSLFIIFLASLPLFLLFRV